MAHTLEELQPGTPVYAGVLHVGDIRSVYAAQGSRAADLLVVRWLDRNEDVALPAGEVESVDDGGVHLMDSNPQSYSSLAPFDAARFPTVHLLS
ncbi:MAG: hypothetical protein NVS2B17_13970 [Candidatus Velthaea sp.]